MAGSRKTRAWFISDRSGFRYPYSERVRETSGILVGPDETDGKFDIINHPQNKSPRVTERISLKDARPDTILATTGDASWTVSLTTHV
jgi:hypothetical protein